MNKIKKPDCIQENVPLHDKNWFQTGGPARLFAPVTSTQEFQEALAYARNAELDLFVLGNGANVLVSDDGFDGLVIRPHLNDITHEQDHDQQVLVHAGAGVSIHDLILYCLDNNIIGLEEFSGIPSTVGGAMYNNLHYFKFSLAQFVAQGTVIDRATGQLSTVPIEWFQHGYDQSKFHEKNHFLVNATLRLKKADDLTTAYAHGRRAEIIRHRNARYPSTHTCGCFFRNFHPDEVSLTVTGTDKKMIYAAYYLDKLGLKGALNIGGAVVSHQHANMLVNNGNATSQDLITLARTMQEKVYEHYGILPQPECELVGFKEYPLLPPNK